MRPLCIAHRGASADAPENTLPAFQRALTLRVDGIELDTQVTADGVAVVFHDRTLTRLTGAKGRLADCTLAELAGLRVRGERIPTLTDVLGLARGHAVLQIEIKPAVPIAPVLQAIRRTDSAAHVILASSAGTILREVAARAPRIPRMIIVGAPSRISSPQAVALSLCRKMAATGACGISVCHQAVKSALVVDSVRCHGAQLWCWTVNDPARMRRLRDFGVDALLSDNPALLLKTLADP